MKFVSNQINKILPPPQGQAPIPEPKPLDRNTKIGCGIVLAVVLAPLLFILIIATKDCGKSRCDALRERYGRAMTECKD